MADQTAREDGRHRSGSPDMLWGKSRTTRKDGHEQANTKSGISLSVPGSSWVAIRFRD